MAALGCACHFVEISPTDTNRKIAVTKERIEDPIHPIKQDPILIATSQSLETNRYVLILRRVHTDSSYNFTYTSHISPTIYHDRRSSSTREEEGLLLQHCSGCSNEHV